MIVYIALIFMLTIAAFWGTAREDTAEQAASTYGRPAGVMTTYHGAASRACNASCPDGVVPSSQVRTYMPTMFQSTWGQIEAIGYKSFAVTAPDPITGLQSHFLVTVLQSPNDDRGRQVNAQVMDWLYSNLTIDSLAYTGTYDAATGRMTNKAALAQVSGDGKPVPVRNVVFQVGNGGLALPSGTPMMVTRIPPFP